LKSARSGAYDVIHFLYSLEFIQHIEENAQPNIALCVCKLSTQPSIVVTSRGKVAFNRKRKAWWKISPSSPGYQPCGVLPSRSAVGCEESTTRSAIQKPAYQWKVDLSFSSAPFKRAWIVAIDKFSWCAMLR
jgi:hypothetical protein